MNNVIKIILLITCFIPLSLYSATMPFKFSGTLVKSACNLKTEHIDVPLGEIDKNTLIKNHRSDPVDFSISLTDCDPNIKQSVSLIFTADNYPDVPNKIKPSGETTAEGVVIGVYYGNRPIPISESTPLKLEDIITGKEVELPFTAQMETIGYTPVVTGDVEGFLNFIVSYE